MNLQEQASLVGSSMQFLLVHECKSVWLDAQKEKEDALGLTRQPPMASYQPLKSILLSL